MPPMTVRAAVKLFMDIQQAYIDHGTRIPFIVFMANIMTEEGLDWLRAMSDREFHDLYMKFFGQMATPEGFMEGLRAGNPTMELAPNLTVTEFLEKFGSRRLTDKEFGDLVHFTTHRFLDPMNS